MRVFKQELCKFRSHFSVVQFRNTKINKVSKYLQMATQPRTYTSSETENYLEKKFKVFSPRVIETFVKSCESLEDLQ